MKTLVLIMIGVLAYSVQGFGKNELVTNPDTTASLVEKGKCQYALADGRHKYLANDVRGALHIFRGILADCPDNAMAHFRIAECHLKLFNYDLALKYLDKAVEFKADVSKETPYLYGQVYHKQGEVDKALENFKKFKESVSDKKAEDMNVNLYINHCETAKMLMAKPLDAEVKNIGTPVNSRDDDYAPFPLGDSMIVFVSRRNTSKGGLTGPDNKYFEDIYFSLKKEDGSWDKPEHLVGKINTDEHDNVNHISADGKTIYMTQNIDGHTKSSDIAVAKLGKSGKWGMAKLMPKKMINSTYFEACPTLDAAESVMYFVSERNGGKGGADIYKSPKVGKRDFGQAVPVEELNTKHQETTVFLHSDGKVMFFSSNREGSMGGYDIFKTTWNGSSWGEPVNLGYPINSVNDDLHFKLSSDGKTGYFSSIRADNVGDRDIYEVDLSKVDVMK